VTRWWRTAPGIVGLCVVAALLSVMFLPRGDLTRDASSFGVGRDGYRLAYELLGELGYPVERFGHGAEALPAEGALWVLEPGPALLDAGPAGMRAVAEWVERGNVLLLGFGGERRDLATRLLRDIEERKLEEFEDDLRDLEQRHDIEVIDEPLFPQGDSWEALHALGIRGVEHPGGRTPLDVGFDDPVEVQSPLVDVSTLRAARNAPVLEGPGLEAGEVLAGTEDGPLVWRTELGEGQVVLVSDARLLCNWALSGADNAYLLVTLAEMPARGGAILVEEFSHGYTPATSPVKLLLTPPALWITVQVVLVIGAVVLWRWRRFGPALPAATGDRRSKAEHVSALADLHKRGHHRDSAAARMRSALLGRVRDRMGAQLSDEALLQWLRRRLPAAAAELERPPPQGVDDRTLLRYARTLERIRREIEEAR